MTASLLRRFGIGLALSAFAALSGACAAQSSEDDGTADEALADPGNVNIGSNGAKDQFAYLARFQKAEGTTNGPSICHWYVPWNVALGPEGDPADQHSRAYLESWLKAAQGTCDEALISFKSPAPANPPSQADYKAAMQAFLSTPWAAKTGYAGAFSFTPWNEPNNGADAGNGLGKALEPELAATYFLTLEKLCKANGCKVAAGDFASNGDMWLAYSWNCDDDNVPANQLCESGACKDGDRCKTPSSENKANAPASYLDRYKNAIVNGAAGYDLGADYRPKYFAFHGWHDINTYLDNGSHCDSYENCATRRMLKSLGGSWSGTAIWDTEVGMGQSAPIADHDQACGAAFLLRMTTISPRIGRLYYTRFYGGGPELFTSQSGTDVARPAFTILAKREPNGASGCK